MEHNTTGQFKREELKLLFDRLGGIRTITAAVANKHNKTERDLPEFVQ
jgi:hypothetical protein